MKRYGTINSHISKVLSDLGHTDTIAIADIGLPIPTGITKIDLAVRKGLPDFLTILSVLLDDMVIEKYFLAEEIIMHNPTIHSKLLEQLEGIEVNYISHELFKQRLQHVKVVIRTGEATPYANCILQAGVAF